MADARILAAVKKAEGITGTYQDDALSVYIDEVIQYMVDAGVPSSVANSPASAGVINRGVEDLRYNGGNFSSYFCQRVTQLSHSGESEIEKLRQEVKELQEQVELKQKEIENLQQELDAQQPTIDALEQEVAVLQEQIATKQSVIEALTLQVAQLNADKTELQEQVAELEEENATISETAYEEGVNAARNQFGAPNEVTGTNIVTCDYVNENEHEVEVKLSSDTVTDFSGCEVKALGKNLAETILTSKNVDGIDFTVSDDGTIIANGTATATIPSLELAKTGTLPIGSYVLNGCDFPTGHTTYFTLRNTDKSIYHILRNGEVGFEILEPTEMTIFLYVRHTNELKNVELKPMIRLSSINDSIFEPFKEKIYTSNTDGTLSIPSISPIMNIICDSVDISAKYYCCPSVEYDRFWDNFQNYGKRDNYKYAFYEEYWNEKTFKPKYKVTPTNCGCMCERSRIKSITLEDFDFSKPTTFDSILSYSYTEDATMDVSSATNLRSAFQANHTIKKIKLLNVSENCLFNSAFHYCDALTDVEIVGVIGKDINLQWSNLLTVESAKNIIQCLANLIETNSFAMTVTFHANVWAKLDAEGSTSPNGNAWKDYINDIGWNWA